MHSQEVVEMCLEFVYPRVFSLSCLDALYLCDLINVSCYLWDLYRTRYSLV